MRFLALTSLLAVTVVGTHGLSVDYHSHYSVNGLNLASLNETMTGAKAGPASTIERPRQKFPPITIDPSEKYVVSWEVEGANITFQLTVQTQGFVAFGISNDGKEQGADIVAVQVLSGFDFRDYYGKDHERPTQDVSQDWALISGSREDGFTFLEFSRKLDTGDAAEDVVIEDKDTYLIWAFSISDYPILSYHLNRTDTHGAYKVNLLNLDPTTPGPSLTTEEEPSSTQARR